MVRVMVIINLHAVTAEGRPAWDAHGCVSLLFAFVYRMCL